MLDLAGFMVGAVDEGGADFRLVPHHHYASYPWWSETTQAVLAAMRDEVQPGMRVLDFGCGASAILSLASAALGATPYPVEFMPELAAIAQQQIEANGLTHTVTSEPPDAPYDFAVANVGDAVLVGQVSNLAPHGIGTDADGGLIRW